MKKRNWQLVFLIIVICLVISIGVEFFARNAVTKTTDGDAPVMGMVVTLTEDDWQDEVFSETKKCAQNSGYEVMTIQVERSRDEQIEAIRALIVYRVDVIVLFPIVDSGWDAVLIEAQEANIPVITADKGIRKSDVFAANYVGYNYYDDAAKAADNLAQQARQGDMLVELYGTLGSYQAKEITRAFRETLGQTGLEIQSSVSGDYMRSRGKEITEGFLKSNTGVDYIIAHNDAMAIGAVEAIEEQGKKAGTDVKIFAIGGGNETLSLLAEGKINCLISRDVQKLGEGIVTAADELLRVATLENNSFLIETEMLVKGEVES